jgi:hypothetical protein
VIPDATTYRTTSVRTPTLPHQYKVTNQQNMGGFFHSQHQLPHKRVKNAAALKHISLKLSPAEKSPLTDSRESKLLSAIPTQCFSHVLVPHNAPSQAAQAHDFSQSPG